MSNESTSTARLQAKLETLQRLRLKGPVKWTRESQWDSQYDEFGHRFRSKTPLERRKMPKTHRDKGPTPVSAKRVRKILWGQGLQASLAPLICNRIQAALECSGTNLIDDGELWNEVVIRGTSFYSRLHHLKYWREANMALRARRRDGTIGKGDAAFKDWTPEQHELLQMIRTDCHGSFQQAWAGMDEGARAQTWQYLALWLLEHDPRQIPDFLLVSVQDGQKPDMIMIADCLRYVDRFYYSDWLKDWRHGEHTYTSLVDTCLHPVTWPILNLSQISVHFFIKRSSPAALARAFGMTRHRKHRLAPETILAFMFRFTEYGNVDLALEALDRLVQLQHPDFTLESESVKWHCCKLLLLDTVEEVPEGRNFRILPVLLQMGVLPDQPMMNIVLSNAYKTGDPRIGVDMLYFMKNFDHELDNYTYLTLLSEALRRGDRARVNALIVEIESKDEILRNPYITSKLVYAHYVFNAKDLDANEDPQQAFLVMLESYARFHDITPLKQLGIVSPTYTPRGRSFNISPVPSTLYTMLATYVRRTKSLSDVQRVYTRFRELVMQGDPAFTALTKTDHFYNEFLLALRGDPDALSFCVQVVKDMLEAPVGQVDQLTGQPIVHAMPTIRTWALLLSDFIYCRHVNASEQIKELMDKYDVRYDHALWNIIISGYASMQHVPKTAATIKAMERAGYSIDAYTMKHLRYLRNPDRLRITLDELDQKQTFASDWKRMPKWLLQKNHSDDRSSDDQFLQSLDSKSLPKGEEPELQD